MENIQLQQMLLQLQGISIYRNLKKHPVTENIGTLIHAVRTLDETAFFGAWSHLTAIGAEGEGTVVALAHAILWDDNVWSRSAASGNTVPEETQAAAMFDFSALACLCILDHELLIRVAQKAFSGKPHVRDILNRLPVWRRGSLPEGHPLYKLNDGILEHETLWQWHQTHGAGIFARYHGLIWTEQEGGTPGFSGVDHTDPVKLSELTGYEAEREEVLENTRMLLCGMPANNVLLYGDRGTGKSSTVKAILNQWGQRGLRMVEVPKRALADFPEIIRRLADLPYKFILFIDDLTLEDNEDQFTALKAVLEGGLAVRPANVAIYATTNRRHLVRERFADRQGDEVRAADTMQEKLSLADRFGLVVTFSLPDQNRFLAIVDALADRCGLGTETSVLHAEALKWTLWNNGRSPRAARQFVEWMAGKEKISGYPEV